VSLDPGNAENVTALAALYERAGDGAESRALLERAATLRPGDVEMGQRLADLNSRQPTSYTPSGSSAASASSAVPASSGAAPASPPRDSSIRSTTCAAREGADAGRRAPPAAASVVRASAQELGENETRWRDKAAARREAIRAAEQFVATLKAQIDQLQRHAGQASADGDLEREMAKTQDDLESAQERLAKAQRRMEDLQDEARRKGLPPDWLR